MSKIITINEAWENIFHVLLIQSQLDESGIAFVTADQIKNISSKEPRLMCKFDYRDSRPKIIAKNDITILPIKNGEYALIKGDGYNELPLISEHVEYLEWPSRLQTLPKEFRSESQVIDTAFAAGILNSFLDDVNLTLTIRGRLRNAPFSFFFNSDQPGGHKLNIDGVQVEVDSGYETAEKVYLIEAKMGERDDFHIRQLYYPMRMWLEEGVTKPIVPIFISYANNIISISEYQFDDWMDYSSIQLVKHGNYSFDSSPVKINLCQILATTMVDSIESTPFPQADDIRKVRDTIDMVVRGDNTSEKISECWDIDYRQGDYYANAAKYLGFLEKYYIKKDVYWKLTDLGREYVNVSTTKRDLMFIQSILKHPVFYYCLNHYFQNNNIIDIDYIKMQIANHTTLSNDTVDRRARTVKKWVTWLVDSFNE